LMANKETDSYVKYPTTFLEPEGTATKRALHIAYKYGCVLEKILPMNEVKLSPRNRAEFYFLASKLRINSYFSYGSDKPLDLEKLRKGLASNGPILVRLLADKTWEDVGDTGKLETYEPSRKTYGHAVCVVGYTEDDYFIVRNSWGNEWGDKGFAYASPEYAREAFSEAMVQLCKSHSAKEETC